MPLQGPSKLSMLSMTVWGRLSSHWSYQGRIERHWSYGSLVLRAIGPTGHWSYVYTIGPTGHWSYGSFVLRAIGPTACCRTLILSDKGRTI